MKTKILIISLILGVVLLSGCEVTNRQNFYFDDTENIVMNEMKCYNICQNRANNDWHYKCDYSPVVCDNGKCVCKTW